MKTKYASKGLNMQPYVMVVGATLGRLTNHYVVIENTPVELESTKRAVEVAFYTYHALQTGYPRQSYRPWVVLQKALFGVTDPSDSLSNQTAKYPDVIRLINILKV